MIRQALSTARRRFHNPNTNAYPRPKHHLLWEYHPELEPVRRELRKIGVSTTFSCNNTLGNLLSKTGPVKPRENELPGVYKIQCKLYPEGVYYGETGVNLSYRMSQHKNDIKDGKVYNGLFIHMRDNP